jgi:hypothetical protein
MTGFPARFRSTRGEVLVTDTMNDCRVRSPTNSCRSHVRTRTVAMLLCCCQCCVATAPNLVASMPSVCTMRSIFDIAVSVCYSNTPSTSIELAFFARTQRLRSSVKGLLKTVVRTRSAFSTPSMAYIGMLVVTVWGTHHVQSQRRCVVL